MKPFGSEVKDIKPRIKIAAATGKSKWVLPPANAVMVLEATYQCNKSDSFIHKIAIYFNKTDKDFWWCCLNKMGLPPNNLREGPFDFAYKARDHALEYFFLNTTDVYRVA